MSRPASLWGYPPGEPEPSFIHPTHRAPSATWRYTGETGATVFFVCRFDPPGKRKQFAPRTLWREGESLRWRWKAPPGLYPLYGLDRLAENFSAPVVVIEGERCVEAARPVFRDAVVVTSMGGAQAPANSDWRALWDREVLIYPDLDDSGAGYANHMARILQDFARCIYIVDVETLVAHGPMGEPRQPEDGDDVVNLLEEGWESALLRERVLSLAAPFVPPGKGPSNPPDMEALDHITSDRDVARELRRLSQMKPLDYQRQRRDAARALGMKADHLDAAVECLRGKDDSEGPRAQRDILLGLVKEGDFVHDSAGEACATVVEGGIRKTFRVRSGGFRSVLIRLWTSARGQLREERRQTETEQQSQSREERRQKRREERRERRREERREQRLPELQPDTPTRFNVQSAPEGADCAKCSSI